TSDGGIMEGRTSVVYYCATCEVEQGKAEVKLLGRLYRCVEDKAELPEHLARIVKIPQGPFWLRMERRIRSWQQEYSPANLCQWLADRVGIYVAIRLGL